MPMSGLYSAASKCSECKFSNKSEQFLILELISSNCPKFSF